MQKIGILKVEMKEYLIWKSQKQLFLEEGNSYNTLKEFERLQSTALCNGNEKICPYSILFASMTTITSKPHSDSLLVDLGWEIQMSIHIGFLRETKIAKEIINGYLWHFYS